jgi:hypothetical protein
MRDGLRRTAPLLVALVFPALTTAAPRISLGPVRGDTQAVLKKQLASALCKNYECVPISRLRTRGRLDFSKVEAQGVAGILAGTVARRRGGRTLELALLTRSLAPVWGRSYPLTGRGTLSPGSTADLQDELAARLESAAPAPAAPPPRVRAAPAPAPAIPPVAAAPPVAPEPPPVAAPAEARPEPLPVAPPPPIAEPQPAPTPTEKAPAVARGRAPLAESEEARGRLLAAVEAGVQVVQRKLTYDGVPAGNSSLRGYQADAIVSPRIHLELFPLSLVAEGALAGVGLLADYGLSVGLKTKDPGGAEHASRFTRLGVGLCWRLHPSPSSRFALVPAVSYQQLKLTVDPLAGAPIPGLPDADLSGVKASLGVEIPVGGAVSVLIGAGYVRWTTAKDLVGVGFFPSGSAYALEADAGLSVALAGMLSLRILGEMSSTRYSLTPSPGGTYQANGATDQYLGGRAMLRAEF